MWYKLNESIGIVLLVLAVGGGSIWGVYKFVTGPPLVRQNHQVLDARTNGYSRGIMKEHDRTMRQIQRQHEEAIQRAIEVGRQATSR